MSERSWSQRRSERGFAARTGPSLGVAGARRADSSAGGWGGVSTVDRVVADVHARARDPGSRIQAKCARAALCSCKSCSKVQMKEGSAAEPNGGAPRAAGQPLPSGLRETMEASFQHGFEDVRIHDDPPAASTAKDMGALAYTQGRDITFASGQWRPGTRSGQELLAHELAHVVQQAYGAEDVQGAGLSYDAYEREADLAAERVVSGALAGPLTGVGRMLQRKDKALPPLAKLQINLHNATFVPVEGSMLHVGPPEPQFLGMILRRMMDAKYVPGIEDVLIADTPAIKGRWFEPPAPPSIEAPEPIPSITVHPVVMVLLSKWLNGEGYEDALSDAEWDMISMGMAAAHAFPLFAHQLPAWYDETLAITMLHQYGRFLKAFMAAAEGDEGVLAMPLTDLGTGAAAVATQIGDALLPAAKVLESIRKDGALTDHAAYQALWPTKVANTAGAPPKAPANEKPMHGPAVQALTFIPTWPEHLEEAMGEDSEVAAQARKVILDRLAPRFGAPRKPKETDGAAVIDQPSGYNVEPYSASLFMHPAIEPPRFLATIRGEYVATMAVHYPNIWAAWRRPNYTFERVKIPKDAVVKAGQALEGKAEEAGALDSLRHRIAKDAEYNEADLENYYFKLATEYGMPGAAVAAYSVNSLLRFAGSTIKTGFQAMADRPWVARMNFPEEGMYMVRATATFPRWEKDNVVLPPSVAYWPVFATDSEILAGIGVEQQQEQIEAAKEEVTKLTSQLEDPEADTTKISDEIQLAKLSYAGAFELLHHRRRDLVWAAHKSKGNPKEKERIEAEITKLDAILELREARGLRPTSERLIATMVTDQGDVLNLLLETEKVSDNDDGTETWMVSDSTVPKGKTGTGTHAQRSEAVRAAVKATLEQGGYGRGRAAVVVGDAVLSVRVDASASELLKEAAGNVALVMSLAAVAAAPFTAGESLVLLIPAGIIGAVPSAFRIVERGLDHTLEWDLELAMDVVNIVGAFVGLGAETQLAKRAVGLGNALLVTGIGAGGAGILMMGANLYRQIESVEELPESMRAAALMEIIGHAFLDAGIMVGSAVMAQSKIRSQQRTVGALETHYSRWLESLNDETKALLESDPALAKAYMQMEPRVRALLTLCASPCIRNPPPTRAQQGHIADIESRLAPDDNRLFQSFLHDNWGDSAMTTDLRTMRKLDDASLSGTLHALVEVDSALLMNFSESVKGARDPASWTPEQQSLRDLAKKVATNSNLDLATSGRILDNVRRMPGGDPLKMLVYLDELATRNLPGTSKVLADLAGYRMLHKGAAWVLRAIHEGGLWDSVRAFEISGEAAGRRYDVLIGKSYYELKSWQAFYESKFIPQIIYDFAGGEVVSRRTVYWVFEPGLGSAAEIITMMEAAIDNARKTNKRMTASLAAEIKIALPDIVIVGPPPKP